jgi:hypothetical protein
MESRRYVAELGAGLGAYVAVLTASIVLLRGNDVGVPWRTVVALAPMVPGCGMCWAIVRQIARVDELQRRIQYESIAIAFAATALITFSYGFLENVGYPRLSMVTVWPVMAVIWGVCVGINAWRYA